MLRQIQPRNARSKRALEKREPKAVENPKTALFLRGTKCSQAVQDALADLYSLSAPFAKKFTKKNDVRPFEDPSSLAFFSEKNDASLLVFGSSTKKRPHAITIARTFSHQILDMLEVHLDPTTLRTLPQFRTQKPAVGLRPMLVFAGVAFESPIPDEYTLAKSLLVDFFKGEVSDKMDVEGLRYVILVAAAAGANAEDKPPIRIRGYTIQTKRSGQKLPRVEVQEMGPRMDLRVGRMKEADEAVWKEAMRRPKGVEERTKKNVSTDRMGDKVGRIHLGKQDLGQLQTRKMKGLKRGRDEGEDGGRDEGRDGSGHDETEAKKQKA